MTSTTRWELRVATPADVPQICRFGQVHLPDHYAPLIGAEAARLQVERWWNADQIGAAVSRGLVTVADAGDRIVGVAQRGHDGTDHVIYKLYVDPGYRGRGLGVELIAAVVQQLPPEADRVCIEHFAANRRAGSFYQREGFTVQRVEPHPGGDARLDVVWRVRGRRIGPPQRIDGAGGHGARGWATRAE